MQQTITLIFHTEEGEPNWQPGNVTPNFHALLRRILNADVSIVLSKDGNLHPPMGGVIYGHVVPVIPDSSVVSGLPVYAQLPNKPASTRRVGYAPDNMTSEEVAAHIGMPADALVTGRIVSAKGERRWRLVGLTLPVEA